MIGVYIMSVLRTGLPSMDLQAHYQTFFTGIVVIGAVLLDIYRNKKASEVRILSPSDLYKENTVRNINALKKEGKTEEASRLKQEMKATFVKMKAEEKAEKARLLAEEREAEKQFELEMKAQQD